MTLSKFRLHLLLALVSISSLLVTSCNDKQETQEVSTEIPQEASLEQKKQALERVVPITNPGVSSGDVAMNPAHGQPGHRCDIPVGAPLNGSSKPAGKATPVQMDMNKANSTPTSGKGLNPPHGQPGHRCDISVGAPL